jgi:hypothetical protein
MTRPLHTETYNGREILIEGVPCPGTSTSGMGMHCRVDGVIVGARGRSDVTSKEELVSEARARIDELNEHGGLKGFLLPLVGMHPALMARPVAVKVGDVVWFRHVGGGLTPALVHSVQGDVIDLAYLSLDQSGVLWCLRTIEQLTI